MEETSRGLNNKNEQGSDSMKALKQTNTKSTSFFVKITKTLNASMTSLYWIFFAYLTFSICFSRLITIIEPNSLKFLFPEIPLASLITLITLKINQSYKITYPLLFLLFSLISDFLIIKFCSKSLIPQ